MAAESLKNYDVRAAGLDALILADKEAAVLESGYKRLELDVPEWLTDKLTEISRELDFRKEGELRRKLKAAKSRLETLKEKSERRADTEAEIAALEAKLK